MENAKSVHEAEMQFGRERYEREMEYMNMVHEVEILRLRERREGKERERKEGGEGGEEAERKEGLEEQGMNEEDGGNDVSKKGVKRKRDDKASNQSIPKKRDDGALSEGEGDDAEAEEEDDWRDPNFGRRRAGLRENPQQRRFFGS